MKIRNGFVSNSSSSSFMIYGAFIDGDKIREIYAEPLKNDEDFDFYDEVIKWSIKNSLLAMNDDGCDDGFFVGRDPITIGDDETGKQFKQDVQDKIEQFFGKIVCKYIYGEVGC